MNEKLKKIVKSKYFIGSLIITMMYIIFLAINSVYPFGDQTFLYGDMKEQYVNLFCYLKNILLGSKGIFMSWNLGMANNFYINFIYYLLNPINILVIFFDNDNIYICIELLVYIKLLLVFNFFVLYLEKIYGYKKKDLILFGLLYTFSSYMIKYFFNIMWIDVMYMLPISIISINEYLKKDKLYPIILSYIYMIFIQYYMAYSMIIFCSIYYVVMFIVQKKGNFKIFMKKSINLLIATVLVVGTMMFIFMPTLASLNDITGSKTEFFNSKKFYILDFINNFTNKFSNIERCGFAFCGSITTVLMVIYFCNSKITIKEKLIYLALIIFLLMPIFSPFLYKLWHAGTATNGHNFRYAYVLIFVFVTIGFRAYQNLSKKGFILISALFAIMLEIEIILSINNLVYGDKTYYLKIIISSICVIISIILLFIKARSKDNYKIENIILALLIIFEIIEISIVFWYNMFMVDQVSIEEFNKNEIENMVSRVENPEFERIMIDNDNYGNMSMRYNYSTFKFFISGRNMKTLMNMNKIGYTICYNCFEETSRTIVNDIISGIKYYIIDKNIDTNCKSLLEFVGETDKSYIYKNKYSLPFVYYLKDKVKLSEDLFENQNNILNSWEEKTENKYIYDITEENNIVSYVRSEEDLDLDLKYFNYTIKYEVIAQKEIELYAYSTRREGYENINIVYDENRNIKFTNAEVSSLNSWPPNIVEEFYANRYITHMNSLQKGEKYCFEIYANKEEYEKNGLDIKFYAFDDEKIKDKVESVNKDIFKLKNIGKNSLDGTVTLKDDGYICYEISYDEGWHVIVDGKEVEKEAIYDCFLGVRLSSGQHKVKIYYIPPGLEAGLIVSLCSGIILTIFLKVRKKFELGIEKCKEI